MFIDMLARTPNGPLAHVRRLQRLVPDAHRGALVAVRLTLSVVYIWFGALKVAGATPVAELVTATTPWPDPSWFMPALGGIEVSIGIWLLTGRALLVALPLFTGHMLATLAALALLPQVMFQQGNPLLLTTLGEFVLKNTVLLAAGVAAMTSAHIAKNSQTPRAVNPTGAAEPVTVPVPPPSGLSGFRPVSVSPSESEGGRSAMASYDPLRTVVMVPSDR